MKFSSEKPKAYIAFLDILFVMILSVSGSIPGILSTIVYFLAFLVPIIIGYHGTAKNNNPRDFVSEFKISASAPFAFPTLASVMLLAFVTSAVITAITGKTNTVDLGDSVVTATILHALLPAILEEGLFRYIPMRAMKGERPLVVIIYTGALFALIHHSFFSLPYAFFAGAVFMLLDLMVGSVWPSVIIHFLNNLLSVLWYFYSGKEAFVPIVIASLTLLVAVSLALIIKNRKYYGERLRELLSPSDTKIEIPSEAWILTVPMLVLAILELI